MAKRTEKELALRLRREGKSYAEIRTQVPVTKSTLSLWLREHPLSAEQMRAVRDLNPRRIENYRKTRQAQPDRVWQSALMKARRDMGTLSKREQLMAGFFLYWAEGTKADPWQVALANTDPAVARYFVGWLKLLGVNRDQLKIKLHLYKDMDIERETMYWSKQVAIPVKQFIKPYIKNSRLSDLTYKNGFGHGTCNALYGNREMKDYILASIQYLRESTGTHP